MIKNVLTAVLLISSASIAPSVLSQVEDPLLLRARWLVVSPHDKSSTITTIGGTASVDTNIAPEIDLSYFFTDNIAVELITAVTTHRARANGTVAGNINLGEVTLLPPTLTVQWNFLPHSFINPYVGAGVNYTYFFGVNSGPLATHIDYDNSFGAVLQAGANINFSRKWHINLDIKKVWINTEATVQLAAPPVLSTSIDIDPWIIGVGIGYRFC